MVLDPRFKLSFPGPQFADNVRRLEMHLGFPHTETPPAVLTLTNPAGKTLVIKAEPGKFASVFFLRWLSRGLPRFTIDAEMHAVVKRFFDPVWNEPNHPTIDFLREPGVRVQITDANDSPD